MEKQCFKCKKKKKLKFFYLHSQTKDGHLNKCRFCTKLDVKKRYHKEFEKIQAYEKLRFQKPERKKLLRKYQEKRRKKYPGKERARKKTSSAIRDNKIIRNPCEICGDKKSEAHHLDYRRPFLISWLCFKHHRKLHGQLKT